MKIRGPLVVRLTGAAGSGKTTLLLRALPLLTHDRAGIVEANPPRPDRPPLSGFHDVALVEATKAHWRKGFLECISELGEVELALCEDRDGPLGSISGLGEDVLVAVVTPGEVGALTQEELQEIQCVVVTHLDAAPQGFDIEVVQRDLREVNHDLAVFGVALDGVDNPGLGEWSRWLEERSRTHRS
jgi:energy-coupling factor transporter ATP-binding protein EcfA2